jgi:hypothetical protein
MEAMMNLLKQQNPEMASYLEMMQAQQNAAPVIEEAEFEELKSKHEAQLQQLDEINKRLFAIVGRLQQQLQAEMRLNDELANAMGACPDCLGSNEACNVCRGQGKPGYFVPDFVLYNRFVQPAVNSFNRHFLQSN